MLHQLSVGKPESVFVFGLWLALVRKLAVVQTVLDHRVETHEKVASQAAARAAYFIRKVHLVLPWVYILENQTLF